MTPSLTSLELAAQLVRLAGILPGDHRLWTAQERKQARLLVSLIAEHSLAAERAKR